MSDLTAKEQPNMDNGAETVQEYTKDQRMELEAGRNENLNVDLYANKEFLAIQMHQIRLGLLEGLDASVYANPAYDWFQMEEIRLGLAAGLDVSSYANPENPFDTMQQIRLGMEAGINLAPYKQFPAGVLKQLRLAVLNRVNLVSYIKAGYDTEQLESIRYALEKKLNLTPFLRKEYRGVSIMEICIGLEHGVNVALYTSPEYSWQQMREIRLGLEHMLDVDQYRNHYYTWQQMREIRFGLEDGLDVTYYKSLMYTSEEMRERRLELKEGKVVYTKEIVETEEEQSPTEKPAPENFCIRVSPDEMEAVLEIIDSGKPITLTDISRELRRQDICNGVLYEKIDKVLSEGGYSKPITIAKGFPTQDGVDGYYEFFFRTDLDRAPKIMDNGEVDYRNTEWFEMVEKGQKLAEYHSATSGVPGVTITGRMIPAKRGRECSILIGTGFTRLPDGKTYVADSNGMVTLNNNQLTVSQILMVEEVNLATGDVNFQGNVVVNGNVSSGANVTATGDVYIKGFVECATVICGGSAVLFQGMNGAGTGSVHATRDVQGSFFEAAVIEAGGNIQGNYFLNCNMHTREKIFVTGKKGSLAGGMAYAEAGIVANNLGNQAGLATYVKLGASESLDNKDDILKKKIDDTKRELKTLKNAHGDFQKKYSVEVLNTTELYLKLESALYTKERELDALSRELKKVEEEKKKKEYVTAVIERRLYDGVTVEIDKIRWHADKINVTGIVLKRQDNRIVIISNN